MQYVPNIFQGGAPKPAAVEAAIRRSLGSLQTERLDLVQMHWWDYSVPGMVDTAKALAECQSKGLIRSIGLTNVDTESVAAIADAGVPVVCNQVWNTGGLSCRGMRGGRNCAGAELCQRCAWLRGHSTAHPSGHSVCIIQGCALRRQRGACPQAAYSIARGHTACTRGAVCSQ